jgi:O-antigen/teichoic acid export membrane protein
MEEGGIATNAVAGNDTARDAYQRRLLAMLPFIRDIVTTASARIVAMVGPFAVSIITARILGPEERGRYFLIVALAQIGAQIGNLGLQSSNTYLAAKRFELVAPLMANSFIVAWTVVPFVTFLMALVFGQPESVGLGALAGSALGSTAFVAVLIAPLSISSLYLTNMAIAIGRVQLFNGLTVAYGILAVAVALIVAGAGGSTSEFLLGAAVALVIPTLFGIGRVLAGQWDRFRPNIALFRRGIAYATKAYLATMFGFIMTRVGAFALQYQSSLEEVGQFSVATQFADGLALLPSTVGILLFPKLLRAETQQRWSTMWQTFWGVGAAMLLILSMVAGLVHWLVPLMFGHAFAKAAVLVQALMPSVLIVSLTSVVSQYLAAQGFPKGQVLAWLFGLTVHTGLSYWLAGIWGAVGVAVATAISAAFVFALLLFEAFCLRDEPH